MPKQNFFLNDVMNSIFKRISNRKINHNQKRKVVDNNGRGKILKDEILSENELNKVSGGKRYEIYQDGHELYRRGLLSKEDENCFAKISDAIQNLGYKYEMHGMFKGNIRGKNNEYFNKNGVSVSRDEFWKNFDAENGTKIIN